MAGKQRPVAQSTVQIHNDRVIVTEWRFAAGAETGWHRHEYDYVVVPRADGRLRLESAEGVHESVSQAGVSYYRNAGTEHNVINANDFEYAFIEIELKH